MTSKFSIDNRELLQRISSGEAVVGIDFGNLIVRELAAFRLAAMDSDPVAVTGNGLNVALSLTQMQIDWICNTCASIYNTRNDDVAQGYINEIRATLERLAAMDSEPVAFTEKHEISNMHATGLYLRAWPADRARNSVEGYTIPLYTTPQPISLVNSEPVAYIFKHPAGRLFWALTDESNKGQNDVMPVYASPQPAPERDRVRREHAEWSQATFGNVGPVGPLKHLSKEALEAAAEPGDLSEWADMQFLLWDAQRRAGVTDEQITRAMIDKLAVNKQREWPEPKDGELRLHIKAQPAPVVPDEKDKTVDADDHPLLWSFNEGWNACRAAMLAAAPHDTPALNSLQSVDSVAGKWIPVSERMPEVGVKVLCFPVKDEPIHATFNGQLWLQDVSWSGSEEPIDNVIPVTVTHWMPLPAGPQEVKGE